MPIMTTFYMVWGHHERAFVGGRATSPNIYKMADGGHIEFRKIPKYFRTIDEDFFAHNLLQTCNTDNCKTLSACNVVDSVATTTTSS